MKKSYILLSKWDQLEAEFVKALRGHHLLFNIFNFSGYLDALRKAREEQGINYPKGKNIKNIPKDVVTYLLTEEITGRKGTDVPLILSGLNCQENHLDLAVNIITSNGFQKPEIIHLSLSVMDCFRKKIEQDRANNRYCKNERDIFSDNLQDIDNLHSRMIARAKRLGLEVRRIADPSKDLELDSGLCA